MELIGLSGLGNLREPDAIAIAQQQVLIAIKSLPEGNAVDLLKQLPSSIITKICHDGVQEQISQYLPVALSGLGAGLAVGFSTGSFVYGSLAALTVAGIVYFIQKPKDA